MNPFTHPEFWLSVAFFVVLGLLFVSPIQRAIKKFFDVRRQAVEEQIQESRSVYQQAEKEHKILLKSLKNKIDNTETKIKIRQIQQEFLQKEKSSIMAKKQDFQVRQNIFVMQTKENLKTQLLNCAEERILNPKRLGHSASQDLDHFIKALHENEEKLKALLD